MRAKRQRQKAAAKARRAQWGDAAAQRGQRRSERCDVSSDEEEGDDDDDQDEMDHESYRYYGEQSDSHYDSDHPYSA